MQPPCQYGPAVCGYGDPNADVHVIGDHPGVHGGIDSGIPFTGTKGGRRLRNVLESVGLLRSTPDEPMDPINCFLSYLHMCPPEDGKAPSSTGYDDLERFFDAELRAVNAHILLPMGKQATDRILTRYTTQRSKVPEAMQKRHALEIRGRGFLVIPAVEPAEWSPTEQERFEQTLETILASDYRQTKGVATMIG